MPEGKKGKGKEKKKEKEKKTEPFTVRSFSISRSTQLLRPLKGELPNTFIISIPYFYSSHLHCLEIR